MKKKKIIIAFTSLLAISLLATGCGKEIAMKNGSKVAVSVGKNKFTATEYYEKIKEDNISHLVDMIDHSLFDKKYKTDSDEKESINNQIEQIKSYYGEDEETYASILQQYFGVETEEELRTKLSLEYKRNLAVKDYVKDHIKDDEVKKYYNEKTTGQMKASHILISVDVKDDATDEEKEKAEKEAKEKAEKVIKELDKGKKFEDLAKKYSSDNATVSSGGDLGYFDLDTMVEDFANAVRELKKDEYTKEPVKTEYGYHVILKTGEKKKPKLNKVKENIKEKLRDQKLKEDSSLYYESLKAIREDKKISWNDDVLKKAYNEYVNKQSENAKKDS